MATTVDELDIQITASASGASKAIANLDSKLKTLSNSLSSLNTHGLNSLAGGVKTLTNAMNGFSNIKTTDFTRLAKGIEKLGSIDGSKLQSVANGLTPVARATRELSAVSFNGDGISNLSKSIRQLSGVDLGNVGTNLESLKNSLSSFINGMNGIGELTFNTTNLNELFNSLRSIGGKVGNAATANLPNISRDLKAFVTDMNDIGELSFNVSSLSELITAISTLGRKSATTAATNLPLLAKELNNFMNTLSKAPAVSQNVINMTNALARFARTGSSGGAAANSLTRSLSNIGTSAGRNSSGISGLTNQLKKLIPTMGKASSSTKSLFSVFSRLAIIVGTVRGAFGALKSSIEASSDLTEVQNVIDVTFGDYKNKIEELGNTSIENFGMSELTAKQIAGRFQAMGTAMGIARGEMSDMSVQLTELAADMASFYDVDQKDVAKSLQSIFTGETEPLRRFGTDISVASLQSFALSRGLNANVNSMSQAEKAMLRYQYVLQTTGAAQGDFLRTQDTWSNQVRILKQNLQQLATIVGGVLVNAFKPLVKALNVAMGYLTSFAKTVSNALGKIFGWTYEEGGGITSDFEGAADAADDLASGTGKAAKNIDKIKKGIRAFDELNVIDLGNDDDGASGGGTGASGLGALGDVGTSGEWKQTESIIKKFESDIDSLEKLGKYISDKITKTLQGIDWDSVYKGASNFGTGLASFLNGLLQPEMFATMGTTVANTINTVGHALDGFGTTFNWSQLGADIATFFNNFNYGIDWELAYKNAVTYGQGIGDAINSFFADMDFKEAGATVANALNVPIKFFLELGKTIDFEKIGDDISDSINGFFEKFEFGDLANTIDVWVQGVWTTLKTAIEGIEWKDVWNGVKDFIGNLDLETVEIIVGALVIKKILGLSLGSKALSFIGTQISSKIKEAIVSKFGGVGIGQAIWTAISTSWASLGGLGGILTEDLAVILGAGTLTEIGLTIATGLVGGIIAGIVGTEAGKLIGKALFPEDAEYYENFKYFGEGGLFDTLIGSIQDGTISGAFEEMGNDIYDFFYDLGVAEDDWVHLKFIPWFKEGTTKVSGFFGDLRTNVRDKWHDASDWFSTNVSTPIKDKFKEATENIKTFWGDTKTNVTDKWNDASTWFSNNVSTPIHDKFKEVTGNISGFWSSTKDNINSKWSDVSSWFSNNVSTPIHNKFKEVTGNVSGFFGNAKDSVQEKWNLVSSWFESNVANPISDKFRGATDGIKNFFSNAWDNIKNTTQEKWNSITSIFSSGGQIFEGIKDGIADVFKNIVNKLISGINKVIAVPFKTINGLLNDIRGLDILGTKPFSGLWEKNPLPVPEIPRLATGGMVYKPTIAQIGEAGKEGILPLTNRPAMQQLVNEILDAGYSSGRNGTNMDGIRDAILSSHAEEMRYMQEQNNLLTELLMKEFGITENQIGIAAQNYARGYIKRTGKPAYT